jgi:hypothetical protein
MDSDDGGGEWLRITLQQNTVQFPQLGLEIARNAVVEEGIAPLRHSMNMYRNPSVKDEISLSPHLAALVEGQPPLCALLHTSCFADAASSARRLRLEVVDAEAGISLPQRLKPLLPSAARVPAWAWPALTAIPAAPSLPPIVTSDELAQLCCLPMPEHIMPRPRHLVFRHRDAASDLYKLDATAHHIVFHMATAEGTWVEMWREERTDEALENAIATLECDPSLEKAEDAGVESLF